MFETHRYILQYLEQNTYLQDTSHLSIKFNMSAYTYYMYYLDSRNKDIMIPSTMYSQMQKQVST